MENKAVRFSVQMTAKEVYRFLMYHTYHGVTGILGCVLSVAALVRLVVSFQDLSDQDKTIMAIVAAWFLVFEPLKMIWSAKVQAKTTKAYQKALDYTVSADGITVAQGEEEQTIAWDNLLKASETGSQYLVYSSKIHAFIFPKTSVGEKKQELEEALLAGAQSGNVRLSGKLKAKAKK